MSRSGYSDDCGQRELACYRGAVTAAMRGRRGQIFLRELLAALEAMPKKELIGGALVTPAGEYCALGVVGAARGVDMADLDPEDAETVAARFDIAGALAREVVFENDEFPYDETPVQRWSRMRRWAHRLVHGDSPEAVARMLQGNWP